MWEEDAMLDEVTLRNSLKLAVKTEKLGAVFYKTLASRFGDNEELHELFSLLEKDERTHEAQFRTLLEKAPEEENRSGEEDERHQFLAAISISEFFKGEDGAFHRAEKIETRDDALGMAFSFEKSTLLFYQGVKDAYGSDELLDEIIRAEKSHVVSVMKYMMTDAKMRGLSDDW